MTEKSNENKHGNRGLFDNDVRTGSGSVAADEKLVGDKGYTRNAPDKSYRRIIAELETDLAEWKLSHGRLEDRVIETQEFGLAEIAKLKKELAELKAGKYTRNAPMIAGTQESYERIIDKLEKELAEWKLSQGRLECRVIETQELALAEINKLKAEKENLFETEANLSCEVVRLQDRNRQLEDENSNLHKTIDAVEKKSGDLDGRVKGYSNRLRELEDDKIDSALRIEQLIDDVEGLEKQIDMLEKEKPKTDGAFGSLVDRYIKDSKYLRNKIKGLEAELILALHSSVKLSKKCSRIQDIIKEKI